MKPADLNADHNLQSHVTFSQLLQIISPPFIPLFLPLWDSTWGIVSVENLYRRRVGTHPNQMLKEHAGFDDTAPRSTLIPCGWRLLVSAVVTTDGNYSSDADV